MVGLGTSVRQRGLDHFWIRRELGAVVVALVGCEVQVEWLSIAVVFSPSDSAPVTVLTNSHSLVFTPDVLCVSLL